MDLARAAALRRPLAATGWVDGARDLVRALRAGTRTPGGLLLVGTPEDEPWHLTAHLADGARWAGTPELAPTLVRWAPPPGAPPHLAVGLRRLEEAGRGEAVLVVAPSRAGQDLLERVDGARRAGALVTSLDAGDDELGALVSERLVAAPSALVPATGVERGLLAEAEPFDLAQHLVGAAAADRDPDRRGWRDRLLGALGSGR